MWPSSSTAVLQADGSSRMLLSTAPAPMWLPKHARVATQASTTQGMQESPANAQLTAA